MAWDWPSNDPFRESDCDSQAALGEAGCRPQKRCTRARARQQLSLEPDKTIDSDRHLHS